MEFNGVLRCVEALKKSAIKYLWLAETLKFLLYFNTLLHIRHRLISAGYYCANQFCALMCTDKSMLNKVYFLRICDFLQFEPKDKYHFCIIHSIFSEIHSFEFLLRFGNNLGWLAEVSHLIENQLARTDGSFLIGFLKASDIFRKDGASWKFALNA